MSRVLITGSTDGLGRLTAQSLMVAGHQVVVHARNSRRADALADLIERGAELIVGDFSDRDDVRAVAAALDDGRPLDAVVHNVGVGSGPAVMPVNVVAPYLLTALLPSPRRLIYLSSSMHSGGNASLAGVDWQGHKAGSYSDSKLFITAFAAAVARLWPDVLSNAVDPGWVPTRMGGSGAPDDLTAGHRTQEWLATSEDPDALTSGGYWHHRQRRRPHPAVVDHHFQDELLRALVDETGTPLPHRDTRGSSTSPA